MSETNGTPTPPNKDAGQRDPATGRWRMGNTASKGLINNPVGDGGFRSYWRKVLMAQPEVKDADPRSTSEILHDVMRMGLLEAERKKLRLSREVVMLFEAIADRIDGAPMQKHQHEFQGVDASKMAAETLQARHGEVMALMAGATETSNGVIGSNGHG